MHLITDDRILQLWLKVARVIAVTVSICTVAYISVVPQVSNDFWLQVKVGELIWKNKSIPTTVLFPFTEARHNQFNAHEWLPSLFFFGLISFVGERWLPLVMGAMGLFLFAVYGALSFRRTSGAGGHWAIIFGMIAVLVENQRHYLRPELLSLLLMGIYLHFMEACRNESKFRYWISGWIVVVIWSNSHGSFILAPVVSALYGIGSLNKQMLTSDFKRTNRALPFHYAIFTCLLFLGSLINPRGIELWQFVMNFGHSDIAKELVGEWVSTLDLRWITNRGFWMGVLCVLMTMGFMIVNRRRVGYLELLIFFLFVGLAVQAIRFLVYLGIMASYVVPGILPYHWNNFCCRIKVYAGSACMSAIVLILAASYGNVMGVFPHSAPEVTESLSDQMVQQLLRPEINGNVLNSYELGAELVFRAYPKLRPSIDSRIDSYGGEWMKFNASLFRNDQLLRTFISRYDVKFMLLTHDDFLLLRRLDSWSDGLWAVEAIDRRTVLLTISK
ncbi:MAG: hypothetical protein E6Q78_06435 [Rhodoferax sp.]|nr:MAG: hypothetical protein E6Q78_06435 [Rhodoferax sp.]